MNWMTEARWSPYAVGVGIGVLSWLTFRISRKPIGCSSAYARSSGMIEKLFRGEKVNQKLYYRNLPPVVDWEWMLVLGIVIGAFVSASISGNLQLQWVPARWAGALGAEPLRRLLVALVGGICLGFGAR